MSLTPGSELEVLAQGELMPELGQGPPDVFALLTDLIAASAD